MVEKNERRFPPLIFRLIREFSDLSLVGKSSENPRVSPVKSGLGQVRSSHCLKFPHLLSIVSMGME